MPSTPMKVADLELILVNILYQSHSHAFKRCQNVGKGYSRRQPVANNRFEPESVKKQNNTIKRSMQNIYGMTG